MQQATGQVHNPSASISHPQHRPAASLRSARTVVFDAPHQQVQRLTATLGTFIETEISPKDSVSMVQASLNMHMAGVQRCSLRSILSQ